MAKKESKAMTLRFECRKCGFKDVYTIANMIDLHMAGTAFGERHIQQAHPEFGDRVKEAELRVVAEYVKLLDNNTGMEIPMDKALEMG